MPVIVRKPAPQPPAPTPAPAAQPAPAGLTAAEVEAMLAARDAVWSKQLAALTQAFTAALAARPEPAPPPPRKGADVKFKFAPNGSILSAEIVPKG